MSTETVRRRGPRPRLVAGLAAMVLSAASAVLVTPAPASAAGGTCSPSSAGVTVVVDFASLGGGVIVACAPGDPGSGVDALRNAGFTPVGTQNYGLAFVCRIDGKPSADPCVNTPPASASWSYWHAAPGGSWSYSTIGAASDHPKPGSVEGWAFGPGAAPSIAPPALIADPPPPPPPPPPAPSSTTTRASTANQPPASSGTTTSVEAGNTSTSVTTTPTSATTAASTPSTTRSPAAQAPAAPAGFPYGLVAGVALVVALAGAAGFTAWRRRRQPSG